MKPPGQPQSPGRWIRETTHVPGSPTHLYRTVFPPLMAEGSRRALARYGLPYDHLAQVVINGRFYVSLRPLARLARGSYRPAFLWGVLLRADPVLRVRGRRADRAFAERWWRDDRQRWDREDRPRLLAANLAIQAEAPERLDDKALADHVRRALALFADGMLVHFELSVGASLPVGELLVQGQTWSLSPELLLTALKGSSPASHEALAHLAPMARLIADSGARPTTLADVRNLHPELRVRLDRYLELFGWRLTTGFDFDACALVELPSAVLAAIRRPPVPPATAPDAEQAAKAARALVPRSDRGRFDRLLTDAKEGYGLRDDNVGLAGMWPAGLVRRALLEVGRRLHRTGRILQVDHALELLPEELDALLAGSGDPHPEVIAARRQARALAAEQPAPLMLGDDPPSPPRWALPPAMTRGANAYAAYAGLNDSHPAAGAHRVPRPVVLRGFGIGGGVVRGRARLVPDGKVMATVRPGDVLVVDCGAPTLQAIMPQLGGLVAATGGPLSHLAILARECSLPSVVGATDATRSISEGDLVELDAGQGEVRVVEHSPSPVRHPSRPLLVVLVGPVAAGKTALATRIRQTIGAELVSNDNLRQRMFSRPTYLDDENAAVYDAALARIESLLRQGRTVVYDGTNLTRALRARLHERAASIGEELWVLVCVRSQVMAERLDRRDRQGSTGNEGGSTWWQVYQRLCAQLEPLDSGFVLVDGSSSANGLLRLLQWLVPAPSTGDHDGVREATQ